MYRGCHDKLTWISSRSRALFGPTQPCRHLLASDWFVKADGNLPKLHMRAMTSCFQEVMQDNASASREWYHVEKHHALRAVSAIASLERAAAADYNGFMAYLETAMLVRADRCLQRSHMSAVASRLRTKMGKPACEVVDPKVDPHTMLPVGEDYAKLALGS